MVESQDHSIEIDLFDKQILFHLKEQKKDISIHFENHHLF
jgi:hypothetical protein